LACPRDIELLRPLCHPNIMRSFDAVVDVAACPPVARLYTDYYSNGSLNDKLCCRFGHRRRRRHHRGARGVCVARLFFSLVRAPALV
jgi:hypothetical protein